MTIDIIQLVTTQEAANFHLGVREDQIMESKYRVPNKTGWYTKDDTRPLIPLALWEDLFIPAKRTFGRVEFLDARGQIKVTPISNTYLRGFIWDTSPVDEVLLERSGLQSEEQRRFAEAYKFKTTFKSRIFGTNGDKKVSKELLDFFLDLFSDYHVAQAPVKIMVFHKETKKWVQVNSPVDYLNLLETPETETLATT